MRQWIIAGSVLVGAMLTYAAGYEVIIRAVPFAWSEDLRATNERQADIELQFWSSEISRLTLDGIRLEQAQRADPSNEHITRARQFNEEKVRRAEERLDEAKELKKGLAE